LVLGSSIRAIVLGTLVFTLTPPGRASSQTTRPFTSADLYELRSVGDVQLSPDGRHVAFGVTSAERPGRPTTQIMLMELPSGTPRPLGGSAEGASSPRWSPDGSRVAFFGRSGERFGVMVADANGTSLRFIAATQGTNHPLPSSGDRLAWSPDGTRIAFISATAGPEADANGDPMVITRYLYKPTATEGLTRFNDNRRLHIFVAVLSSGKVEQLTKGDFYEHSIRWSPLGDEILFVSNREPDADRVFNYDILAVKVADGSQRMLSRTKSAEYSPAWSPDGKSIAFLGTRRELTSSETTMEDTHVWLMDASGENRRELVTIDNRQGAPQWAAGGRQIYFTVQERGNVRLYRQPAAGGVPSVVVEDVGSVGSYSVARDSIVAYAFSTPTSPSELYLTMGGKPRAVTSLNAALLAERTVAPTESFTFSSVDGLQVEAFITRPAAPPAGSRVPMIVMIHGGPHGQQGPAFNSKAQIYAGKGWAALMVNYRGSTGYGQKHADAIFGDQNGKEAKDVLAGVDAALTRYAFLDPERIGVEGGSYGGQLANWLVTQTTRFRAAVPAAGISNLVTQNYLSYYHDYLAVEFGGYPHEGMLMDTLWARSAIRYVNKVKTPVMFVHGENDNDVPIAEAEQFYIALKDVGVETVMVRYPREGHGIRETKHVADVVDRSIGWYERWFRAPRAGTPPTVVP
jgi:dipeptidyl aminopeptidase/acylaminoacyl peptidase